MSMQIQDTFDPQLVLDFFNLSFYRKNLRMQSFIRVVPITIQIKTSEIASEVSIDYPVDIDHWKYFEYVVL